MHFVYAKGILTGSDGFCGINVYRGCSHKQFSSLSFCCLVVFVVAKVQKIVDINNHFIVFFSRSKRQAAPDGYQMPLKYKGARLLFLGQCCIVNEDVFTR